MTIEPYYTNARKTTKKYTNNLKKLSDTEKEILKETNRMLDYYKKCIENDFSIVYMEEADKSLENIVILLNKE